MNNYIEEYFDGIKCGEYNVGKHIFKLYDKLTLGIQDGAYIYNAKIADNAIQFIENFCRHSKGRNDLIKLELWQKALIASIFALVNNDGVRNFREVFIIIGRKNGKSLLASAIMAYSAFMEAEYGAEIYCVATKKSQAEIVFDCFRSIVAADEELAESCAKKKYGIYIEETNTTVQPLPATPESFDGLNPTLIICDEVAAWRGENGIKQYEVLKSAMGARKQPLIINITTAGYESGGIYDELYKRGTAFLNGDSRESRFLPIMYTIDDMGLWNDLSELEKSNPNMDVSVPYNYFLDEISIAEMSDRKKTEFIVKYCNIKQNPVTSWLPFEVINNAGIDKKLEDFRGCYAVGGFDLSMTTDLTAASLLIEKDGIIYVFAKLFMPAEKFKREQARYQVNNLFIEQGILQISGEGFVNYNDVLDWFIEIRDKYGIIIQYIGYDRYSAKELVHNLKKNGFKTDDVWQGWNMHPMIIEFEGLIKEGKIKICNNELLKLHLRNVALFENTNQGKYQMVKMSPTARIDGAVAVICGMTMRHKYYKQKSEILKNEE